MVPDQDSDRASRRSLPKGSTPALSTFRFSGCLHLDGVTRGSEGRRDDAACTSHSACLTSTWPTWLTRSSPTPRRRRAHRRRLPPDHRPCASTATAAHRLTEAGSSAAKGRRSTAPTSVGAALVRLVGSARQAPEDEPGAFCPTVRYPCSRPAPLLLPSASSGLYIGRSRHVPWCWPPPAKSVPATYGSTPSRQPA